MTVRGLATAMGALAAEAVVAGAAVAVDLVAGLAVAGLETSTGGL